MKRNRKGAALLASGMLLAGVSLAGVFAAVVDTASSGELSVESAEIPAKDIDIKIDDAARAQTSNANCQDATNYVDDATTPYITITDAAPGAEVIKDFCIINEGTDDATMSVDLINAVDVEVGACSTTELAGGDTTCADGEAGELSDYVDVSLKMHGEIGGPGINGDTCEGSFNTPEVTVPAQATATPFEIEGWSSDPLVFAAGDAACLQVKLTYDASTPEAAELLGQTDKVAVQLRFNAE